jgi:hypothetical protein
MSDWDNALWMIEEGFTAAQLKELPPSDADAYRRLKPMLVDANKPSSSHQTIKKTDRKQRRIGLMRDAMLHLHRYRVGEKTWFKFKDVRDAHEKSVTTVYHDLLSLQKAGVVEKMTKTGGHNSGAYIRFIDEEHAPPIEVVRFKTLPVLSDAVTTKPPSKRETYEAAFNEHYPLLTRNLAQPERTCKGKTLGGKRCQMKYCHPLCEREPIHFCLMHCDCKHCSKRHTTMQGRYY